MTCVIPAIFLIVATAQGPRVMPVDYKELNPDIQKAVTDHEGCRERNLGICIQAVKLDTRTGKMIRHCGTPVEASSK